MENTFTKETFVCGDITQPYRFHRPEHFEEGKKYPLVLFLHGAGERGDENEAQLRIGILTALSDPESPLHESFIVCPQCPLEKQWVDTRWDQGSYSTDEVPETVYLATAHKLVAEIKENYPVNEKKVFVMGISMGGYGTWDSLARHTETFAGGFACCGAGDPSKAGKMKDLKLFAYHGGLDDVVPTQGSRDMYDALVKVGADVKYTEYPELYHGSWDAAYSEFDDLKALLAAEKK